MSRGDRRRGRRSLCGALVHSRLRLLGLACLRAAVVAAVAVALAEWAAGDSDAGRRTILLIGVGAAVGCAAAGFQLHPRRSLGLIPIAATGLAVALLAAALSDAVWSAACVGRPRSVRRRRGACTAGSRSGGGPARLPAMPLDAAGACLALLRAGPGSQPESSSRPPSSARPPSSPRRMLFVPTLELLVEILVWPMYDVRVHGPGADRTPRRGPLLVIANHSSYADPFWLSIVAAAQGHSPDDQRLLRPAGPPLADGPR